MYLARISQDNFNGLIFTDLIKYSPVSDYLPQVQNFSDFLNLKSSQIEALDIKLNNTLKPNVEYLDLIDTQKIFATGCTFEWSEEKLQTLAEADVYKKAYLSSRSMFFLKGTKENLTSNFGSIGIRKDSLTTIPEAEIVAVFNSEHQIIGYTIGNDVTAVDIEKQNPLFQMQAKFYKGSVSLLPLIKIGTTFPDTNLYCTVIRNDKCIVEISYHSKTFNRSVDEIVGQLANLGLTSNGGFLFLGCGVSYPKNDALIPNDKIIIKADFLPLSLQTSASHI